MIDIEDDMNTSLGLISDEFLKYGSYNMLLLVEIAFSELKKSVTSGAINPSFAKIALSSALMLTEFGYNAEQIACALLYYPYIFNDITSSDIKLKLIYENSIISSLDTLVTISKYFEGYLPWVNGLIDPTNLKVASKKEYWEERSLVIKSDAFLAIANSPEVAVIKLVDREHLLKNIEEFSLDDNISKLLANDSIDIMAPAAEALGVWSLKWKIEDYAFKIINPNVYNEIVKDLNEKRNQREKFIEQAINQISQKLKENDIPAHVTGRPKHIYGLYKKMLQQKKPIMEINDNLAIRIITEAKGNDDCYKALAVLVDNWKVAAGVYEGGKKARDWIDNPKPNGYQSIHTTIIYEGRLLEIQIRNQEMHDLAEYGAAAHWIYRKTGKSESLSHKYQNYIASIKKLRLTQEQYQQKKR